jgi:hypothetical protein
MPTVEVKVMREPKVERRNVAGRRASRKLGHISPEERQGSLTDEKCQRRQMMSI